MSVMILLLDFYEKHLTIPLQFLKLIVMEGSEGVFAGGAKLRNLPPRMRCEIIRERRLKLTEDIVRREPKFTVHFVGSSVYCLDPRIESCGNLDDLDTFIVLPRDFDHQEFVELLGSLVDELECPDAADFELLRKGDVGIIRAGGLYEGIDIGMHIMTTDGFRSILPPFGVGRALLNCLPSKPKYTDKTFVESSLMTGERIDLPADFEVFRDGVILLKEFFGRRVGNIVTLGVLGDKFLVGETAYEFEGARIVDSLRSAMATFVRSLLFFRPAITNEEIVKMFVREERFSIQCRARLNSIIDEQRQKVLALRSS